MRGLSLVLVLVLVLVVCTSCSVSALRMKRLHERLEQAQAQAMELEQAVDLAADQAADEAADLAQDQADQVDQADQTTPKPKPKPKTKPPTHKVSHLQKLDVAQGFHLLSTGTEPVGFITSLNLNGLAISGDLSGIKNPVSPLKTFAHDPVAVLESFEWNTLPNGEIHISGEVSGANQKKIASVLDSHHGPIQVQLKYAVYEWDHAKKAYIIAEEPEAILNGVSVPLNHGPSALVRYGAISAKPSGAAHTYTFTIAIKPKPHQVQYIHVAGKPTAQPWGSN